MILLGAFSKYPWGILQMELAIYKSQPDQFQSQVLYTSYMSVKLSKSPECWPWWLKPVEWQYSNYFSLPSKLHWQVEFNCFYTKYYFEIYNGDMRCDDILFIINGDDNNYNTKTEEYIT